MSPPSPRAELPTLVAHADWGQTPGKRWLAVARRSGAAWRAEPPSPVAAPDRLLASLAALVRPAGSALAGFDFPIGLPRAYARRARVREFRTLFTSLGGPFFEVAERPEEISILRPFYPARPGGTSQAQLVQALGMQGIDDLLRVCERATPSRRAAAPLFWTLGPQQVGKAAISGWRDALIPALRAGLDLALWPFDGPLAELFAPGRVVVAETYPAEAYGHVGVELSAVSEGGPKGKRVQEVRAAQAGRVLAFADRIGVELAPKLRAELADGFGAKPDGEDRFDATLALLGMLNVALGHRPAGEPDDPEIRAVEGWILGQEPPAAEG